LSEPTDILVVGVRGLAFIAVMQSAGSALFSAWADRSLRESGDKLRRVTLVAALLAVLLVVVQHFLEPSRMTASFSGVWDSSLHLILLQSDAGAARAVRILGLAAITIGFWRPGTRRSSLVVVGATLTLSSFLLMGHTADHPQRWFLTILLALHLLISSFWFGALLAFLIAASREPLAVFGDIVDEFSRAAALLVPVIALAGLLMAIILLPGLTALSTPYGRLLMAKIVGFTLLMALAAWNKFRLAPALARGEQAALGRFRRVVAAEWILIAVILGGTALMTGLFGPDHTGEAL
jgi:putative copper resistance protein D